MTEAELEYRDRLATDILQAIYRASAVTVDGEEQAVLNVEIICDALGMVMAAPVDRSPAVKTPRDVRGIAHWLARDMRLKVLQFRRIYEETGAATVRSDGGAAKLIGRVGGPSAA